MDRTIRRSDLPKKNESGKSLKIPVLYQGTIRKICDIHFGDDSLVYLEDGDGVPVKLAELIKLSTEESRLFNFIYAKK